MSEVSEIFALQESYRKQFDWLKEHYPEAYKGLSERHRNTDDFKLESNLIVIDKEKFKEIVKQLSLGADNTKWLKEKFDVTL